MVRDEHRVLKGVVLVLVRRRKRKYFIQHYLFLYCLDMF